MLTTNNEIPGGWGELMVFFPTIKNKQVQELSHLNPGKLVTGLGRKGSSAHYSKRWNRSSPSCGQRQRWKARAKAFPEGNHKRKKWGTEAGEAQTTDTHALLLHILKNKEKKRHTEQLNSPGHDFL